jgi:hypothetical protein
LHTKAGSSNVNIPYVAGLDPHEYFLQTTTLAPIESDGPGDDNEWNLYENFLDISDGDIEQLHDRHRLSRTLRMWRNAKVNIIHLSDMYYVGPC